VCVKDGKTLTSDGAFVTRAELLRRLGRIDDARAAYERALALVHSEAEQRFLEQRLMSL
jgi:RNA polymerase sigma-70 factor (ECF subfamily)